MPEFRALEAVAFMYGLEAKVFGWPNGDNTCVAVCISEVGDYSHARSSPSREIYVHDRVNPCDDMHLKELPGKSWL
jgi:hypothetical protein